MPSTPISTQFVSKGYYLDHRDAGILPWAKRVPLFYGAWMAGQLAKDTYDTRNQPSNERREKLRNTALQLGIPMLATYAATQWQMQPDAEAYNTHPNAVGYFKTQYGESLPFIQHAAEAVQARPLWRTPSLWSATSQVQVKGNLLEQLQRQEKSPLLAVQVGSLIHQLQTALQTQFQTPTGAWKPDALPALQARLASVIRTVEAGIVNTACDADERLEQQTLWKERLHEDVAKLAALPADAKTTQKAFNLLYRNELRLLLPTLESFEEPLTVMGKNGMVWKNLLPVMKQTTREFASEAAKPFLLVGGISVLSGVLAGFLTNQLSYFDARKKLEAQQDASPERSLKHYRRQQDRLAAVQQQQNQHVLKEGVFQYVANIAMCGFGAGFGLLGANILGFTKYSNPMARLASVTTGLGLGIWGGTKLAAPLSEALERFFKPKAGGEELAKKGRKLEGNDVILHFDDLPTAFSVAGMKALTPWIPPFFVQSGIRTAKGYRNTVEEEPRGLSLPLG